MKTMQNDECRVQNEGLTEKEIAKSLRVCADPEKSCGECHMHSKRGCDKDVRIAGAEVIEAQAKRIGELEGQLILKNDELLKLREENQWISVADGLPGAAPDPDESKGIVLVSYTFWDGNIYTTPAYHDGKNWHWWAADYGTLYCDNVADTREATITHWRPMPKRSEGACDE